VSRIFIIISLFPFIASMAFSQPVYLTRTGTASFVSNAPLEIIKAESAEVAGAIDLADQTFVFTIDNRSFKGFNSSLQQEHFYENYMETQLYPSSSFKGKIIEKIDLNSPDVQVVRAKGILNIHGIEQERIIKGTIQVTGGKLLVKADFSIMLEDHQIKVPRVVYQKIAEAVDVSISAQLILKNE
jgi:polyisoprenoid-binding protein YceI